MVRCWVQWVVLRLGLSDVEWVVDWRRLVPTEEIESVAISGVLDSKIQRINSKNSIGLTEVLSGVGGLVDPKDR